MSSRLFQEVREKRGLAYSVYSFNSQHADIGVWGDLRGLPARQGRRSARHLRRRDRQGMRRRPDRRGTAPGQGPAARVDRARPGGPGVADDQARQVRACLPPARAGRRDPGPHRGGDARRGARGRQGDLAGPRRSPSWARTTTRIRSWRASRPRSDRAGLAGSVELRGGGPDDQGRSAGRQGPDGIAGLPDRAGGGGPRARPPRSTWATRSDALAGCDVVVDFTTPAAVMDNLRWCVRHGKSTWWSGPQDLTTDRLAQVADLMLRAAGHERPRRGGSRESIRDTELLGRRGADDEVRRAGRPLLRVRRDHRAAPCATRWTRHQGRRRGPPR